MANPTHCYCDYATGNDYKGATFTDGAYTSATKTLVKLNAFAATKVNHWLYLESNDGGSIVAGYYKVATWTDASTVILATDAGAGVDDDAAKCTQADGSTSKPWRSIQGALDLITRDATNGDQINVKAGTAQVSQAALTLTTYGTPAEGAPLIIRGYTSAANDGGMGEIDANGAAAFASSYGYTILVDLEWHNFGNNHGIQNNTTSAVYHCEVHKGASTPSGKILVGSGFVIGCYVHDAGTTGTGIRSSTTIAYGNYVKDCPNGINANIVINNLIVDCTIAGIASPGDNLFIAGNTVYSSSAATGAGISMSPASAQMHVILNNIVEGYSGAGGVGISLAGDVISLGYNAFYNNTTAKSVVDNFIDLTAGDQTLAASPFVNPGSGDFSLNAAVAGAIETAFPGAWYGPASTTNKADMGAVQKGAGAGSTDTLEVRAGIG